MMIVPERALHWVERWGERGGRIGRHDGAGNPVFEHDADDKQAAAMVAELHSDAIMRHGVVIIIVQMVARAAAEGGFE